MADLDLVMTLALDWAHLGKVGLILVFIFACLLLILTVLIQRPQGGGLAGAFGSGAGSGQTAFGAKTGDALTVATIIMFVFYLAAAVGLSYAVKPGRPGSGTPTVAPAAPAEKAPAGTTTAVPPEQPAQAPAAAPEGSPAKAPEPEPAQPVDPPAQPVPQG